MSSGFSSPSSALGAWLCQQTLWSSLVFVVVATVCVLLRRRAPRLQMGLWSLVLLRLVLPPDLAAPWSARSLLERGPRAFAAAAAAAGEVWHPALAASTDASRGAIGPNRFESRLLQATVAVWLLGMATTAGHRLLQLLRHRRWTRSCSELEDPRLLALVERWRRRLRIRRPVRLLRSWHGCAPFTLGLLRPVVVLPAALSERWDPVDVEPVIAHELAHVKRLDVLWLLLEAAVLCAFFFHPAAWWAAARRHQLREQLCDDLALAGGLTPRSYGETLLAALRLQLDHPRRSAGIAAFNVSWRNHSMRLRAILGHRPTPAWKVVACRALVLASAMLLLPMAPYGATAASPVTAPPVVGAQSQPVPQPRPATLASPLPGARVTSPFGARANPLRSGSQETHRGIDLAAAAGSPVLAPAAGEVTIARTSVEGRERFGTLIELVHADGLRTVYAHLGAVEVKEGQRVERGQAIGKVGSSGQSTGPHLHFEVWEEGAAADPSRYVASW